MSAHPVSIRTVYGGPERNELMPQVIALRQELRSVRLPYSIDVILHLGGSISGPDKTGLDSMRVYASRRNVRADIGIARADLDNTPDVAYLIRRTLSEAFSQIVARVMSKDDSVDLSTAVADLAILKNPHGESRSSPRAAEPNTSRRATP